MFVLKSGGIHLEKKIRSTFFRFIAYEKLLAMKNFVPVLNKLYCTNVHCWFCQ